MPNNYTYRFSNRKPGKHHADTHNPLHHPLKPFPPFYPPYCSTCYPPWFWLLGSKQ